MSVRKIKIIVNDDIRIAKIAKSLNYDEQLKAISSYVETKFNLSSNNYILRYKDDEGDLITLGDSGDLEEAYDTSGLPKIFVELKKKSKENNNNKSNNNNTNDKEEKVSEETSKSCLSGQKLTLMKAKTIYSGRPVECDGCGVSLRGDVEVYHDKSESHDGGYDECVNCYKGIKRVTFDQFIRDVQRNNKLKKEFQNFLVEFLTFVKKSNQNIKEALQQIIKKYKKLSNNDYVKKVMKEQLDILIKQYEDLVKFIAKNINPQDALIYFDMALTSCNNIKTFVLGIPPFKFLFDGLDNGNVNFNWGQTDNGNNTNKKETKEEKQQRKINEKKQKLEKKKQKLLDKLKELELEENRLSKSQEKPKEDPKEENNLDNNNNQPEEEISEEFQILENNNQNEIEIINEEPQENSDVIEEFVYEEALKQIRNMGFTNDDLTKALLMKYSGNTAQTVNDLLS